MGQHLGDRWGDVRVEEAAGGLDVSVALLEFVRPIQRQNRAVVQAKSNEGPVGDIGRALLGVFLGACQVAEERPMSGGAEGASDRTSELRGDAGNVGNAPLFCNGVPGIFRRQMTI
jgi:hypothetical protein